jgi:hypothetical protein
VSVTGPGGRTIAVEVEDGGGVQQLGGGVGPVAVARIDPLLSAVLGSQPPHAVVVTNSRTAIVTPE